MMNPPRLKEISKRILTRNAPKYVPIDPLSRLWFRQQSLAHAVSSQQRGRADDPVAYLRANEQRARERQVAYETVKLLRQKVIECYRAHGVNHYEECREVGKAYYDLIKQKGLGQVQPEWKDSKKKDGWW